MPGSRDDKNEGGLSKFVRGPAGMIFAIVAVLAAVVALYFTFFGKDGQSELVDLNNTRYYIDEDGKSFTRALTEGETSVVTSSTGKKAFPAELCFWTADGKVKDKPTPVLLNEYVGKSGPTFCPDCSRLVVGRNPPAQYEPKPPPTRAEYEQRRPTSKP